jgi:alkaline phosphatase D
MEGESGTRSRAALRRREFLIGGAGAGIALAGPLNYAAIARNLRVPTATQGKFAHGVAAGFPSPKGVTLWTRVSELSRSSKLTLEVAKDKNFRNVVKSKEVVAEGNRDFTVHQHVGGLNPGHEYFYRFATKHKNSRVGRFRTLPPPDSKEKIRLGFYSCQDYEAGYFNTQAALAKADVDLVLCLGDYIYEHRYYPGPSDRLDTLGPNADGDVQTLDEYRSKYRMYQADKDLQAMHASHAFISVWDDHEVEDNYAGDQPDSAAQDPNLENNNEYPRRVPFGQRRKAGYKAFFEAMPRIQMKGAKNQIYGSMRLGGLVELFLTDQRQYRDPQPCDDVLLEPCGTSEDPGRTFLGAEQKAWFKRAVVKSDAKWKLWGSETMVMSLDLPKYQHVSQDQWDGYSAERREILEHFLAKGVTNLTAITGDIHTFLAGDMTTTGNVDGTPVGVELVGGSATSLGFPEYLGVPSSTLEDLRIANDPHVKFADFDRRGFGVVTITKSNLGCEFFAVDALTRGAAATPLASFNVPSGARTLEA